MDTWANSAYAQTDLAVTLKVPGTLDSFEGNTISLPITAFDWSMNGLTYQRSFRRTVFGDRDGNG